MEKLTLIGWTLVLLTGSALWGGVADSGSQIDQGPATLPEPDARFEFNVTAFSCMSYEDGVCLGYDGQVPGPTIVVGTDDVVEITVHNKIAETLPPDAPASAQGLTEANVSLHTHGVHVSADQDGIKAEPGTQLIDSSIAPGDSFTYRFKTPYKGAWHFHDHALGPEGHEGQHRGLYGTMLVLGPGATTDAVLDLHLMDNGVNSGQGLDTTIDADRRFDLAVIGLGNWWYEVSLNGPDGDLIDTDEIGPGNSRAFTVMAPAPGTYTWEVVPPAFVAEPSIGQVVVT